MAKFDRPKSVSKSMQATYDVIVGLTDAVCREHLNTDYAELARAMAAALCRKRPSPFASGQPRTWACAILYELGRLNFLSDPATQPHMTLAELCAAFGVGQSTASSKARIIASALGVNRLNPSWMLPSLLETNPLVWMAEVNGFLVDLRNMPREGSAPAPVRSARRRRSGLLGKTTSLASSARKTGSAAHRRPGETSLDFIVRS